MTIRFETRKQYTTHLEAIAAVVPTKDNAAVEKAVEAYFEAIKDDLLLTVEADDCSLRDSVMSELEAELDEVRESVEELLVTDYGEDTPDSIWWAAFVESEDTLGDVLESLSDDMADNLAESYAYNRSPMSYYGCRDSDF